MIRLPLRLAAACSFITVLLVLPVLAVAQSTQSDLNDPSYDPYSPYTAQQPTRQNGTSQSVSRNAAASQVAAEVPNPDSYQSTEIGNDDTQSSGADARNADEIRDRTIAARRPSQPSEFEKYVSEIVDKPLRRFGANLLIPAARDFTTPPTTTVPPDYRLNPGDELILGLAGSVQANSLWLVIDSEGKVFVPRVGAINLAGVRYGDAPAMIERQLSRYYRDFRVEVSIGRLHGITVYVTGFAATPGSYTVNSLSTLVNAVLAAGGPSSGGSFRSIQLRRGGQLISDFDLYDLLLRGDKSGDSVLQNGDVIYIAPVGAQVAVIGSVNHEAIFEAGPKDTLNDVLLFAGGVNTVADDGRLLVLDSLNLGGGWEELTPSQVQARVAKRGEIVRVLSGVGIARSLGQQAVLVTVSGEVSRPGRYYFQPGTRLTDLIEKAGGLTSQAFPFGSVVTRESVRQQQRISYNRALKDLELLLTTQPLISASRTEALQPARLAAVQSVVKQLRSREPDGRLIFDIPADATSVPGDLVLENNDMVYVPPRPVTVGVFGAVPSPASFAFAGNQTIGEFIKKAGGVQKIGDRSQIFVVHANGTLLAPRRGLFKGSILSERALPGDLIYVPVDGDRGEFWARLKDITGVLFNSAIAAASVKVLAE